MVARIDTLEKLTALVAADKGERDQYDYKKTLVPPFDQYELAKDMAGMANSVGGILLIGVDERRGPQPVEIHGITRKVSQDLEREYDNAIKARLSPKPAVSYETIELNEFSDSLVVLCVHVEPHLHGLVGVRYEVRGIEAWRFPIRRNQHNIDHSPDQLPFLADPEIRRKVVLVDAMKRAIETDANVRAEVYGPDYSAGGSPRRIRSIVINSLENTIGFSACDAQGQSPQPTTMPIDSVITVYKAAPDVWRLSIKGFFRGEPLLHIQRS